MLTKSLSPREACSIEGPDGELLFSAFVYNRASPQNTTMSVTTTNPVSSTVLQALTDYDIHHTGDPEHPRTPDPPNPQRRSSSSENPETWDSDHRRVPPYRPINHELRGPERPNGVNAIEVGFIFTMFLGVRTIAVSLRFRQWLTASLAALLMSVTASGQNMEEYWREAERSLFCLQDWRRVVIRDEGDRFRVKTRSQLLKSTLSLDVMRTFLSQDFFAQHVIAGTFYHPDGLTPSIFP